MKKIIITAISVLSVLFIFAGCGSDNMRDMSSEISSSVDSAEDKVESGLNDIGNGKGNNSDANTNSAKISQDEAKATAFKHAGVDEKDAYDIEVDLETDNGILNYEVTFETKTTEYDYHINAATGEIISSSKDDNDF